MLFKLMKLCEMMGSRSQSKASKSSSGVGSGPAVPSYNVGDRVWVEEKDKKTGAASTHVGTVLFNGAVPPTKGAPHAVPMNECIMHRTEHGWSRSVQDRGPGNGVFLLLTPELSIRGMCVCVCVCFVCTCFQRHTCEHVWVVVW